MTRRCGILCHPTSMPSPYGIGDLGAGLYEFIDFAAQAGQTLWQILPLGPTGYGDSPYQPFSAFAGNPLLIDPEPLRSEGLLTDDELAPSPPFPCDHVSYSNVMTYKSDILRRSYERLLQRPDHALHRGMSDYTERNASWLDDYALFMALKAHHNWASWAEWDPDIALRRPGSVAFWRQRLAYEVDYQKYLQSLFDQQWRAAKQYANDAGITIIGDMPIFVGHDSADVWGHQDLFQLDERGYPTVVAGAPPDYFSATGQLWGNPLYRWDLMKDRGYSWWLARFRRVLTQVNMLRLDHFRGFSGYWEVPADEDTAINGRWVKGPRDSLFAAIRETLGELPIIAEDLGLISEDVIALRDRLGLPGMRVLQFAFDSDASNEHLPHNLARNSLVYTATHDNDTTLGWYRSRGPEIRHRINTYFGTAGHDMNWVMIRLALASIADLAIIPLQDVLGLGSEARLNQPGRPDGNWTWRYRQDQLNPDLARALRDLAIITRRWTPPGQQPPKQQYVTIDYADE